MDRLRATLAGMGQYPPSPPPPSTMTVKRIHREISDLKKEDLGDIKLAPSEESLLCWTGAIPGPADSVYEGGMFEFSLTLPGDYPFTAPKIMFKTRIYHMNISNTGHICLDILKNAWSPALSIFKVILSLSSLLTDPNPSDPLVPQIATEYLKSRPKHDKTAREWTKLYALPLKRPKGEPASTSNTNANRPATSTSLSSPRSLTSLSSALRSAAIALPSTNSISASPSLTSSSSSPLRPLPPPSRRTVLRAASRPSTSSAPIEISDDEEEEGSERPAAAGTKRKRARAGSKPAEPVPKRRSARKAGGSGTNASGSGSGGGGATGQEVIVIEDD